MKEKPKKPSKKKESTPEPVELTPKQQKEKRREEARQRAAETRKIVTAGTNAWTGKLPAQLLNEHCQKLKWERVDYPTKESKESFTASVIVARRNPKTKEIEKVRFDPPIDLFPPQSTAIEARHLAATYGMHRILSHRNMKMMLPPFHRDLWVKMDEEKAAAPPHQQYKWKEDPFLAQEERKAAQKQHQENLKRKQETDKQADVVKAVQASIKAEKQSTPESGEPDKTKKRIRYNATLTMSKEVRFSVENVIRANNGFRFSVSNGLPKSNPAYQTISNALIKLGFEKFQVTEALEYSSSLSEALTWLVVHVPEDDLPKLFMPSEIGSTARISSALNIENAVSRLKAFGFSEEVAYSAVRSRGSYHEAMVYLTQSLINVNESEQTKPTDDIWEEEMESLLAIYGDKIELLDDKSCKITTDHFTLTVFKSKHYPESIPGIGISLKKSTPKYVVLDAIRLTALQAQEQVGDFMLLSTAQWLEDNFQNILKITPKLTQLSSVISGVAEDFETPSNPTKRKDQQRRTKKWQPLDSNALKAEHKALFETTNGVSMLKARQQLPAWAKQQEIIKLIADNRVVLVTGETGSGKSTQVVQFVLDDLISKNEGGAANIICTQPRRISAIGVAQRVADERLSAIGDQVGYAIRGETKSSPKTQLRFVTSGVLLRMIQSDPASLDHISHIVVDEVHERSLDGDFLLILLKRILTKSSSIKVILMSATVDPTLFLNYFKPAVGSVGHTHIEGRTFPVEKIYLDELIKKVDYVPQNLLDEGVTSNEVGRIITQMREGVDYRMVGKTVNYIHKTLGKADGSVVIFMSGAAEIDRAIRAIEEASAGDLWVLPLHASLSPADQKLVFRTAPVGKRKIVVSTNVAETSITISDVVAVIDSGRVKEAVYVPEANVTKLVDNWTSRASATQRMGRAGRVRAGTCYKLYTESIETERMAPRPLPEILRSPLESLYLNVKAMGISNVENFLDNAIDPPDSKALSTARDNLIKYGALTIGAGDLTPLGQHMSLLPVDPQTGKLLVLCSVFGCLGIGLTIAAIVTGKPPFVSPREQKEEAKAAHQAFSTDNQGDILAANQAYEAWRNNSATMARREMKQWCSDNFISDQACREIQSSRRQLLGTLAQLGFLPTDKESNLDESFFVHDESWPLVRAIIGASMAPRLAEIVFPDKAYKETSSGTMEMDPEAQKIRFFTPTSERVFAHPGSLMFGVNKFPQETHYLSFASSIVSSKHFINGVTPLPIYGLLFFGGSMDIDPLGAGVSVDGWTGLKCWPKVGILVQFLKALFDELLSKKFPNPNLDISKSSVLGAVHELISTNGRG